MRHRHWLLIVAAGALAYGYVFVRVPLILTVYPSYGDADIAGATHLAIALLFAWLALEVVHSLRPGRTGTCICGYSLKGVVCPECGRDLGSGRGE